MTTIKFNYRTRQGRPIELKMTSEELQIFETDYKHKLKKKYGDTLMLPTVEMVISEDGTKILDVHPFAGGILKQLNAAQYFV